MLLLLKSQTANVVPWFGILVNIEPTGKSIPDCRLQVYTKFTEMLQRQKIKQYATIAFQADVRLRDVRFAGQVLFVIVVLLVSWSGVKAIDANFVLQKQIAQLQQENDVQQLENTNLSLQNTYFQSDQYL